MFNIQFKKYPVSCFLIAVIWYLSLFFNAPKTPFDSMQLIDKWVHFIMYGGTCLVIWVEYVQKHKSPDYEKLFFWAWLVPVIMGGVLELMQAYCTTTRNGDWLDFAANSTGVTIAGIVGLIGTLLYYRSQRVKGFNRK